MGTDLQMESRWQLLEELSKQEKRLIDKDNSVVIAGGRVI